MRIAVIGAAAAAVLGGTLAVTPVTSVDTPLPRGETCSNSAGGAGCEKLASVLMPEAPAPRTPFSEAGNVIAPGTAPEPAGPAAASEVPAVATGPGFGGGGGAPVTGGGAEVGGFPNVNLGGIPDPYAAIPGVVPAVAGATGLYGGARGAFVAMSLVRGVVGIGTSVVSTAYMGTIAYVYLKNSGLLPSNIGLPSVSIPGLSNVTSNVTNALSNVTKAAAVPALASIPGAAAALPSVSLPKVGLPALPKVGLPAAPALPALPKVGLPAAPALPALPAVGLPAAPALPRLPAVGLPALPGPPAIPHPRFCTPHLGLIGVCTP